MRQCSRKSFGIQPHLQKNWIKSYFMYLCKSPFVMSYSLNNKWERRRQEVVVAQVVLFVVSIVFELNFLLFQVVLTLFSAQFHLYQSSSNHLISHLCCEARPCLHPPALLIIFLRDDYWGGLLKTGELCFWCPLQRFFRIGRVLWAFLVLMYIVVHLFLLERSEVYPSLSAVADSMMKVDVYLTNLTLLPLSTHCTSGECTAQSVSQYTSLSCFTLLLVGKYECYRVGLGWSRRWTTQ